MKNNFGVWIKESLSELGKTQVWLANEVGLQPPQISRIISGYSEATPEILNRIADALHKPRIQAYRAAGHLPENLDENSWAEDMAQKLAKLDPELQDIATRFIKSLLEREPKKKYPKVAISKSTK